MNTALQDTLLQLFQQVSDDPDTLPALPLSGWQEESAQWQLLTGFQRMLERVRQRMQEAFRTEEQLREKEAQYRGIFEATIDALCILDLDGRIVEVNPAACRMYGYSYEELLRMQGADIVSPESLPAVLEAVQTITTGGRLQTMVRANCVRKDGTTYLTEGHVALLTYKGQPHILTVARDITEQVQAEEQLREKEERYRSIFEATTDALCIIDQEGFIVEANPAACRMFGHTYEELIGLNGAVVTDPEMLPVVMEVIRTARPGDAPQPMVRAGGLRKDGTRFPTEGRATWLMYKGRPHIMTVVRDITERLRAEEQLREREAEYRSIFEATTDALIISNPRNGRIVEANPAACSMFGYSYKELLHQNPFALTHPDFHPTLRAYITASRAGRHSHPTRGIGLRKDGTPFRTEGHAAPFMYRGKLHLLVVVRNIDEQVQAEEQLREKEEQYRSIFEASTDGLVINDLEDGHLVQVNPAMCRMHGYTYEEFMSLNPSQFIHPDSLPLFAEYLNTVKAGRRFQARAFDIRKDGTPFPVEVHGTTFTYLGKPHVLAVIRDVTEQVRAEQLLEQRVEERTRELSTLLEVSHNVASTIELKPLLGLILDQLQEVVHYGGAAIATVQEDEFIFLDYLGPLAQERVGQMRSLFSQSAAHQQVLHSGEPVIIADVYEESFLARSLREASREHLGKAAADYMHSWMGIPLKSKEHVIGLLSLSHNEPNYFTTRHARMAMAIANQAAVAIENARLYEQAQALAVLEERQRLARELHDSVSQALYGISLGAHTARTLLQRDPSKVAEPLGYVLTQAETALTEMRALIFELRPESLETEGLVAALRRQAAVLHARHGLEVALELGNEPDLSLKVKQELYRFAQEALHNTIKHARASRVDIRMHESREGFLLEIGDDGGGFDPTAAFPGHLGLHSMRERVSRLGGTLQIESAPGCGTRLHLRL